MDAQYVRWLSREVIPELECWLLKGTVTKLRGEK